MKIKLQFDNSIYNCQVIIRDPSGSRTHTVNLEEDRPVSLETDVAGSDFRLTVIPKMADYESALAGADIQDWKDKLAAKVGRVLFSILDHMLLRVGCTYTVAGIPENGMICLSPQEYVFGMFDRFDLLELIPMAYMFFEASCNGVLCECTDAFATNRKEVLASARKLALVDFGLHLLFTYPIQVGRIKRLTSDKKVKRTLVKFNRSSQEQRQKILEKKEKFMSQ